MKLFYLLWLLFTFAGPLWLLVTHKVTLHAHYRTANRNSAHLAPSPSAEHGAVIQVYTARAFNWRGLFASHCWISVKKEGDDHYTVYQVVGWLTYQGLPALSIMDDIPDRYWYNEKPKVILDIRGPKAKTLIPKIDEAARSYRYAKPYTLWPGPNSNTFPAYVGRVVPELGLVMPADAVGKDFLTESRFFAPAPSGTGYQISLGGVFGLLVARKEGVEINVMGLVYGLKFAPFALLLPGFS